MEITVRLSAVERAGLQSPADGQKIEYELESGRDGRSSAGNISYV
jgi:CspA family cold shock protein